MVVYPGHSTGIAQGKNCQQLWGWGVFKSLDLATTSLACYVDTFELINDNIGLLFKANDIKNEFINDNTVQSENINSTQDEYGSFLIPEDELNSINVEIIKGNRANSQWLILDQTYICHKNDQSVEGDLIYWECSKRRQQNCTFREGTEVNDQGNLRLAFAHKLDVHCCDQNQVAVTNQIFRNRVKDELANNPRAKFTKV